MIILLT